MQSRNRLARGRRPEDIVGIAGLSALLLIAALVPLPFGSVEPWAWGPLAALVGVLLMAQSLGDFAAPLQDRGTLRPLLLPLLLFGVAVGWAVAQCLPALPEAWHNPLWRRVAESLADPGLRGAVSLDPAASRGRILRLLSYAGIFYLAFRCCRDGDRARLLVGGVAVIGSLCAAWALGVFWTGNRILLWTPKADYLGDLTGPFVNRNSYATHIGLALVAALGVGMELVLASLAAAESRRVAVRALIEALTTRGLWILGAVAIDLTALLLTHSRGGLVASLCGIAALFAAACAAPSLKGNWRLGFGGALVIAVLAVLWLSGTVTMERAAEAGWSDPGRPEITRLTLAAMQKTPWLGTGLGSFSSVFPAYRTEAMPGRIDLAHDDYLENLLELGIPAAIALFAAVFVLFLGCVRGVRRRRRDAIFACVGVGATVLVAVHASVDFSLQNPAVTTAYCLLLGAAVAQSTPRPRQAPDDR